MRSFAAAVAPIVLAAAFGWPTPVPTSAPQPTPTVLWDGAPAASFDADLRPYDVTPDGEARALVRLRFRAAGGAPAHLRRGADFDFAPSRGVAQWQTRLRFGGPAALVAESEDGPVAVRVVANRPAGLRTRDVAFDTRGWPLRRVVASALGPHLVRVGWFPRVVHGTVRVERLDARGRRASSVLLAGPVSSWDDPDVRPGTVARYAVVRPERGRTAVAADVPAEPPPSGPDVVRGKGAWLAFSGDSLDDVAYTKLDPERIAAAAKQAGLRYVELRLAYGAFDEATPAAKATVDRLIDALGRAGIATVGWTVPRAVAFDDMARAAAIARYRTPAGTPVRGLAVDLERGGEFMGDGPAGYAALRDYLGVLRRAVGPRTLLVATVEDPFLEHLDQAKYPYAAIARWADVLQPMTYWRMLGPWDSAPKVRAAVSGSAAALRRLAGRPVPLNLGAQTTPLSPRGAPPADEVAAGVEAGRRAGALGVAFYDWTGTTPDQWEAIAAASW
jgi:hypothetical protein